MRSNGITDDSALWLSSAHTALIEIARLHGFRHLVLDIEHGLFDLNELDRLIPFARALGFKVYSKVLAPGAAPVQQALDFGSDAVIIPHIDDIEHARDITAYAKYPGLGKRSYAGGRTVDYAAPGEQFFDRENQRVKCWPMIETPAALADIEQILELPTVDGVFVGPSDLSLSRGRGRYVNNAEDKADLTVIAGAASRAGKPWIMPAWTERERRVSRQLGASLMVVAEEQGLLDAGLSAMATQLASEN